MSDAETSPQITCTEATPGSVSIGRLPQQRVSNRSGAHSTFERLLNDYFARLIVSELPADQKELRHR